MAEQYLKNKDIIKPEDKIEAKTAVPEKKFDTKDINALKDLLKNQTNKETSNVLNGWGTIEQLRNISGLSYSLESLVEDVFEHKMYLSREEKSDLFLLASVMDTEGKVVTLDIDQHLATLPDFEKNLKNNYTLRKRHLGQLKKEISDTYEALLSYEKFLELLVENNSVMRNYFRIYCRWALQTVSHLNDFDRLLPVDIVKTDRKRKDNIENIPFVIHGETYTSLDFYDHFKEIVKNS